MRLPALLLLGLVLLVGCDPRHDDARSLDNLAVSTDQMPEITEVFLTPRDESDNVDSPTVWHGPEDRHLLLATAKSTHTIRVSDATTGRFIQHVGEEGDAPGQFRRPNGIAVIDDLMLVVERDNARVQILSLPDFRPLGTFGEDRLVYPYGLFVYAEAPDTFAVYVTDNYDSDTQDELGERVEQFRFWLNQGTVAHEHVRAFGDTEGAGALRKVESIWGDPLHNRLLIAEEQSDSHIKVYTLDGAFTGDIIDPSFFPNEAEGIVLYDCEDGGGYWLAVDQHDHISTFHVFDRRTLEHVGAFFGAVTANTDGIALTQRAFGPFEHGAFYAVHDDGNTAAFSWTEIADQLGLRADCTPPTQ